MTKEDLQAMISGVARGLEVRDHHPVTMMCGTLSPSRLCLRPPQPLTEGPPSPKQPDRPSCFVQDVEVLPTKVAGDHNRGWCFASFYNHHTADAARKALSPPGFQLHGRPLTVKWAEPKARDEPFASSEPVRALYVTKLPPGANNENLSVRDSPAAATLGAASA